jgi:hypothetical protein
MSVKLKFKNVSLVTDSYGQHLTIKMVQVYKDNKFLKNAKINRDLMQTVSSTSIPLNPIDIDADVEDSLIATAAKFKTNVNDLVRFLLELNKVEADKGFLRVEKAILYEMHVEKKRLIDVNNIRERTKSNLNVVKEAFEKHKKAIDEYNANLQPRLF